MLAMVLLSKSTRSAIGTGGRTFPDQRQYVRATSHCRNDRRCVVEGARRPVRAAYLGTLLVPRLVGRAFPATPFRRVLVRSLGAPLVLRTGDLGTQADPVAPDLPAWSLRPAAGAVGGRRHAA